MTSVYTHVWLHTSSPQISDNNIVPYNQHSVFSGIICILKVHDFDSVEKHG